MEARTRGTAPTPLQFELTFRLSLDRRAEVDLCSSRISLGYLHPSQRSLPPEGKEISPNSRPKEDTGRLRIEREERGRPIPIPDALVVRGRTEGIGEGLRGSRKSRISSLTSGWGNATSLTVVKSTVDSIIPMSAQSHGVGYLRAYHSSFLLVESQVEKSLLQTMEGSRPDCYYQGELEAPRKILNQTGQTLHTRH